MFCLKKRSVGCSVLACFFKMPSSILHNQRPDLKKRRKKKISKHQLSKCRSSFLLLFVLTCSVNIYTCFSLWQTQMGGTWLCAIGILPFVFALRSDWSPRAPTAVCLLWRLLTDPFLSERNPKESWLSHEMEFHVSYQTFFLKRLFMYWSACAIGRLVLVFKWPVLLFGEEILPPPRPFDETHHS